MSTIFVGDVGTVIVLDCGVDVSSATVRKIVVRTARGVKKEWVAQAEGTNSIKYTTLADDIDVAGPWVVQAYIEMPTWKGFGEQARMTVANPL